VGDYGVGGTGQVRRLAAGEAASASASRRYRGLAETADVFDVLVVIAALRQKATILTGGSPANVELRSTRQITNLSYMLA